MECKYFEVCGLPGAYRVGNDPFCLLHHPPGPAKSAQAFQAALLAHLSSGRCDFRWIYFHEAGPNPVFEGRNFSSDVDFRDAVIPSGALNFNDARFEGGLALGGTRVPNLNLNGARVKGALRVDAVIFDNTLDLNGATVDGPIDIKAAQSLVHIRAIAAHLNGGVSLEVPEIHSLLTIANSEVRQHFRVRGRCHTGMWNLLGGKLPALVDLRTCAFNGTLTFSGIRFEDQSVLTLSDAVVHGDFRLAGLLVTPAEIHLNGMTVNGNVVIDADFRAHPPRLVASQDRPRFNGAVTLSNVDVTECLLVGNAFQSMEVSRALWPQWYGRRVLFDEVALRKDRSSIPLSSLKEAYQLLKTKSGDAGDHALAGDFHYGELDMRRHERGAIGSLLCWEFLYWFISGYGTRPSPAFGWLCLLPGLGALLYWWLGSAKDISDALRFSLAVVTLQKREDTSDLGGWIKVVQTVLGAVVLTLFVLAVRMRLKR